MLDVFLVACRAVVVVVVVGEGAATFEIAARWCAWLRFYDLGILYCVRLCLF